MCDELTAADDAAALAKSGPAAGLDRRSFSAAAAGIMAAWSAGPALAAQGLAERKVAIPTADGIADGFFVAPAKGKHPAVLMWPDIAGLRDAYTAMARRLAAAGYAVLVINHYYRSSPAPILKSIAEWRTPAGQAKLAPMIAALSPDGTASDAQSFVRWLDTQPAVDRKRGIGTCGYCMTGPYVVRTAAAAPKRVRTAASFHGAGLVGPEATSPDHLLAATKASFLFAIAQNDDARAPGDKDVLRAAALAAHRPAEIEVYHADHGWCTLDAPSYDKAEAERAWARLLVLLAGL